jgi:hypothetical protein
MLFREDFILIGLETELELLKHFFINSDVLLEVAKNNFSRSSVSVSYTTHRYAALQSQGYLLGKTENDF